MSGRADSVRPWDDRCHRVARGIEEKVMAREAAANPAEIRIRTLIDDWANAIRAKDADRVMARQMADSVTFDLAPPLISTGTDAKDLQAWFSTWQGPLGYELRDLKITAGDDVAFCHGLNRLSGVKNDGEQVEMWFRQTLCFVKIGGEWRIAHQHESVPFHMDGSYRAAVDLKP
jgi:ketosteroid isomerase-like protein